MPGCTDLLLVSETHLTPTISSAAIYIPGFDILRNDSGESPKHGVCAYIKNGLKYDSIDYSQNNALGFRLTSLNVYVYVFYRPPSNSMNENEELLIYLQNCCIDKEAVLMGDFNLPTLDWRCESTSSASACDRRFLDLFDMVGLTQWIKESTFP